MIDDLTFYFINTEVNVISLNFKRPQNISVLNLTILCDSAQNKPLLSNTTPPTVFLILFSPFQYFEVSLSTGSFLSTKRYTGLQGMTIRVGGDHPFLPDISSISPSLLNLSRVAFSSSPSLPGHYAMAFLMAPWPP